MHSPEDPEQRIRDLEGLNRGTAPHEAASYEAASYEEAASYGAAPPPPNRTAGTDRRGISTLLFVLGLLIVILAGAAFLLFGREPTAGTPVAAVDSSAPPRPTPSPSSAPPTIRIIPAPPRVGPDTGPTTAAPGSTTRISGIDLHKSVSCTGGDVAVSGIRNTVEITGHCGRLEVSGIENVVIVDSADVITASGIGSRVTFHAGTPQIDSSGSDVTVEQG